MAVRRARRTGRARRLLVLGAAIAVTGGVVALGLADDPPRTDGPRPAPTDAVTPLQDLDLSGLPIARAPFCDRIDDRSVTAALGGPATAVQEYGNGQRARITTGLRDVAHEYGCSYRSAGGADVRAWVFAAPVRPQTARRLIGPLVRGPGCRQPAGSPVFGRPGVTVLCTSHKPAATTVSLRGLFTDTWLSCELTVPDAGAAVPATTRRGVRWCVHVATTLGARP
jgi:hypothetical protein